MKILLALDSSLKAMDEAVRLAGERRAGLTALFVLDTTWNEYIGHDWLSGSNARAGFLDYVRNEEHLDAQRTLSELEARVKALGGTEQIAYEVKTVAGRVADEIHRELTNGYDLLVMGYPFRRGLEVVRDPLSKILKKTSCSVLLVR